MESLNDGRTGNSPLSSLYQSRNEPKSYHMMDEPMSSKSLLEDLISSKED